MVLGVRALRGTAATHNHSIAWCHPDFRATSFHATRSAGAHSGGGLGRRWLGTPPGCDQRRRSAATAGLRLGLLALVPAGIPGGEEHSHRLVGDPPCQEGKDPRRGSVEPVGVVHDEQQRSGLGRDGQQNPQGGPARRTCSRHMLAPPVSMAAPAGVTPHPAAGGPSIRPIGGRAPRGRSGGRKGGGADDPIPRTTLPGSGRGRRRSAATADRPRVAHLEAGKVGGSLA